MAMLSGANPSGACGTSGEAAWDAVDLLVADHRRVRQLLDDFEDADGDEPAQIEFAQRVCDEWRVHARVERELFYPAVRRALGEGAARRLDDAQSDHGAIDALIASVEVGDPSDARFHAQVRALGTCIGRHVAAEESQLFALARESGLDLRALGAALQARREALLADMGLDPEVVLEDLEDEEAATDAR